MKHPLIMFVKIGQSLLGFLLLAIGGYLILIAFMARLNQAVPLQSEGSLGLLIGSAFPGIPGIVALIGTYGLLKERSWGWGVSLAIDAVVLGLLIYSMLSVRDLALTMLRVAFALMIVLLLLPPVRKFYWDEIRGTPASHVR